MLYTLERKLSWLEKYLYDFINWFYQLDVIFQYAILAIVIYVLLLGIIEFVKKVLIYIPRKIILIVVIVIILYLAFGVF